MKKSLLILLLGVTFGFAQFIGLDPEDLQKKIDKGAVVIDIRTPPEWIQTGIIPTSKKIMFFDQNGQYDIQAWMNEFGKYIKKQDQEFVLVCRSGNRTGMVGSFLSDKLKFKNVYHLQNGINSWIKEKRTTVK